MPVGPTISQSQWLITYRWLINYEIIVMIDYEKLIIDYEKNLSLDTNPYKFVILSKHCGSECIISQNYSVSTQTSKVTSYLCFHHVCSTSAYWCLLFICSFHNTLFAWYLQHMSPSYIFPLHAKGDIYVTVPCAISVYYRRHMSPSYIFPLHAKGNTYVTVPCAISMYYRQHMLPDFIGLNFAGLLSIVAVISTQFSMTWN